MNISVAFVSSFLVNQPLTQRVTCFINFFLEDNWCEGPVNLVNKFTKRGQDPFIANWTKAKKIFGFLFK